ncbi:Wzy polymerase domain-containing protein [Shewanella sp. Isolate11]|uniref:PglL family O-oligosaccharyltransferase n=1 Tax=Shewanella sp. Isolate11 TaxID=2908530 RepID=UPI001EFCC87B|nr:Wzy polymerase domain-containing protein [Shewanella sp. Isolate11]MCG9698271.1 Wzy polymerase domain-containing protein [Shewanella sp. Isolate11]
MTTVTQRYFYIVFALMFAVGMHYFQHNFGGVGLELPFNLVVWSFVSVLIGLGLWSSTEKNTIVYSPLLISVCLFTLVLFIPILYGKNDLLHNSYQRLIGLVAGLTFLFSLYQIRLSLESLQKLTFWILVGVIIEGLTGLLQQYIDVFGNLIGFDATTMRPFGVFRQPNVASTFYVMGIALSAYLLTFKKDITRKQQAILYAAAILSSWLIILNSSKTGTISLFVVLLGTAPLLYRKADRNILRYWYLSILIGLFIPFLVNAFNDEFSVRQISAIVRPTLYLVSLLIISKNLLSGTGYGSFSHSFYQEQANYIETHNFTANQFANNAEHPHNELLLWGVEGGILPIIAIIAIAIFTAYRYFSKGWKVGLFFLAMLFPSLFHSMTELPYYHSAIVFITFIFSLFIIEKSLCKESISNIPSYINFRLSSILLPLVTLIFMLSSLHTFQCLNNYAKSGNSQGRYLQQIINPLPIPNQIEYSWFLAPLLTQKTNPDAIPYFIESTSELVDYWPRARLYNDLAVAYKMIGDENLALKYHQEGKRLFPDFRELTPLQEKQ